MEIEMILKKWRKGAKFAAHTHFGYAREISFYFVGVGVFHPLSSGSFQPLMHSRVKNTRISHHPNGVAEKVCNSSAHRPQNPDWTST